MTVSGVCSCASRAVTVLFVDDDADTRFAYDLVATEVGMLVALAGDGHEAIGLATALLPDVVVLDLGLGDEGGLDGLEVARRLRAGATTREIPIVIVSGSPNPRDEAAVHASGCDGYLVKPCTAEELLGLVTTLALRRRRPTVELDAAADEPHSAAS
jgi:CheY-like chemotaxis protein